MFVLTSCGTSEDLYKPAPELVYTPEVVLEEVPWCCFLEEEFWLVIAMYMSMLQAQAIGHTVTLITHLEPTYYSLRGVLMELEDGPYLMVVQFANLHSAQYFYNTLPVSRRAIHEEFYLVLQKSDWDSMVAILFPAISIGG